MLLNASFTEKMTEIQSGINVIIHAYDYITICRFIHAYVYLRITPLPHSPLCNLYNFLLFTITLFLHTDP